NQTLMHYRASRQATTGASQASLILGREMELPLDRLKAQGSAMPAVSRTRAQAKASILQHQGQMKRHFDQKHRAMDAIRQLQRDGMRTLYRGLLPPLLEKTTSAAIMFGFYEDMSRWLPQPAGSPGLLTNSMAAVLAGTAEATMTPFNRVQTLLQDQRNHSRFNNTFHTFRTLVRDYGVRELYRRMGPILLQNGPYNVLFFGLRGPMKRSLPVAETHVGHLVNDFICGGILGASLNFLFYPLKVLKARKQTQVGGKFQSSWQVLRTIWSEQGGKLSHLY
uniref:Solute carrier family 25 member 51b n=1 Tax=Paramormyrops kingsleyae TaxID=1676925 RepID=A0A3B3RLZ2_9TELE